MIPLETTKIRNNIQSNPGYNYVILVMSGSYNPVHLHHIQCIELVKQHLENDKTIKVVGAYLSTSSDDYVRSKLGRVAIPNYHRYNMLKLATEDSPYIEASGLGVASARQTLGIISKVISKEFKEKVRVLEVGGADFASRYRSSNMIVVGRNGTKVPQNSTFIEADFEGSSTKVRAGDYTLLHPKVLEYTLDNSLLTKNC